MRTQVDPATSERWTTFAAAAQFVIKQDILWQSNTALTKAAKPPAAAAGAAGAGRTGDLRGGGINRRQLKRQGRRPGNQGKPGNGGGGSAGTGGASGSGGASSSGWRRPTKDQREAWFKEGKCLLCGHPDHKKADCPKVKKG